MEKPEKSWIILKALDYVVNLILTLLISFVSIKPAEVTIYMLGCPWSSMLSFNMLNDSFFSSTLLSVEKVSEGEKVENMIVSKWADR